MLDISGRKATSAARALIWSMTSDRALTSKEVGPHFVNDCAGQRFGRSAEGSHKIAWLSIKCNGAQCARQDATGCNTDIGGILVNWVA